MPAYAYIARSSVGTLERGDIEASSPEQARETLRKQQLFAEEIREKKLDAAPAQTFTNAAMPWTTTEDDKPASKKSIPTNDVVEYIPLTDTLRLFAGWLLAWYSMIYLFGSFQLTGKIPTDVPFLQSLFESPLVLRFAFGTFFFLLLTSVHRALGKDVAKGIALAALWIAGMVLFHLYA